jgi:transcriptional regulator with XRE-family HTH domain
MPPTLRPMTLQTLLQRHGITTIKDLAHQAGLTRQHAWNLWHGQAGVGKTMMKRLHERLKIPLEDLILVDQPTPPKPRGRPRQPPKGRPSTPPKEAP